jgi:putative oxidoreductase
MTTIKPATLEHSAVASLEHSAIGSAVSLLGRLMISALFLISGTGKITTPEATVSYIASVGLPFPDLGLAIAIAVELVLVPALVLGYRSRWVATAIAAYCIATAVFFHRGFADLNQLFNFFKNVAIAGGLLQIVGFGAGRFSLDARLQHRAEAVKD